MWESDTSKDNYQTFATCAIPNNAISKTCALAVPEAQLYFSKARFFVGTTDSTNCPIVNFQPYYYQRSQSATYSLPGDTAAIDCSGTNPTLLNTKCFGGAAPNMISTFPKDTGNYFLSNVATEYSFDLNSGNGLRAYNTEVNYHIANDLTILNRASSGSGDQERVPLQYYDYKIQCMDLWGHVLHTLTIIISDDNTVDHDTSTVNDEFLDWNH